MGQSVTEDQAKAVAALETLGEMFLQIKPLFANVVSIARNSGAHGLAFSTLHLVESIDVFQQEVRRFVLEGIEKSK